MIELERHIETLLLSSDCVVVPDFGGFMAHHIEAHFDEADNSFIPPHRTLGFNPKLKMNDSLLAHSYIDAYDLSYPDAMSRINEDVAQLRQQLSTQGYYELHGIGTLSVNAEGNTDFTPCEAGVLTPDLYGLCSFEMKPLEAEHIKQLELPPVSQVSSHTTQEETHATILPDASEESASVLTLTDDNDNEGRTISIRVAWLRNAVAIAAAVLAFFLITTPVSNGVDTDTAANLSSVSLAVITDSQQAKVVSQQPVNATRATVVDNGQQSVAKTQQPVASVQQAENPQPVKTVGNNESTADEFVVVLASHVARGNAESFVERLHQKGYTEARVIERNHTVCVVYGHYGTQGEAYQTANRLHSDAELAQAWVLNVGR
ncbi:MAG: SPOR domain-containing protein [Prevotella sp.]|nr:SPOR domain-containing protein [Prevotella sp.]